MKKVNYTLYQCLSRQIYSLIDAWDDFFPLIKTIILWFHIKLFLIVFMETLKTSKFHNVFKLCTCLCTNIASKCIKQNNKVVLLNMPLSSCNKSVQSVVYLITSLPWFYFIVFLTFISFQDFSVSAVSHFIVHATEAKKKKKGSH